MNIELEYNITINDFLEMLESVGWKTYTEAQVEKALSNTMYIFFISNCYFKTFCLKFQYFILINYFLLSNSSFLII